MQFQQGIFPVGPTATLCILRGAISVGTLRSRGTRWQSRKAESQGPVKKSRQAHLHPWQRVCKSLSLFPPSIAQWRRSNHWSHLDPWGKEQNRKPGRPGAGNWPFCPETFLSYCSSHENVAVVVWATAIWEGAMKGPHTLSLTPGISWDEGLVSMCCNGKSKCGASTGWESDRSRFSVTFSGTY